MAGRDLLADSPAPATSAPAASAAPAGRDLLATTPEEERAARLRQIALTAMKFGSGDPGAGDVYSDSYTLGLMKPVSGLATGLGNWITGKSGFGEGYTAGTGAYQDYLDEAKKNAGWAGTAANVAGSLLTGGPARSAVQTGLGTVLKNAATLGGIEGAARNAEDPTSAVEGALTGAGTAAATAGLVNQVGRSITDGLPFTARRAATNAARDAERLAARGTPPDVLKSQSQALFKQLDDAGVAYNPSQASDLADSVISNLKQNGWDPHPTSVHAPLAGVIGRLDELRGQPVSLETLQNIRSQAGAAARSGDPEVNRIAGHILSGIDGFVTNVDPMLSSLPTDQIAPIWGEARKLWRTANTAADIGWRLDKAARRTASTNSGTNVDNPIRQNIRNVLDKATQPGRYNPYNPAELAQMERVVEGSPRQNFLRYVGNKFGGSGPLGGTASNVMSGAAGTGALALGFDPATAAKIALATKTLGAGGGYLARNAANRMSENEADALVRLISTGSLAPEATTFAGPPTRDALAALMRRQALARGAGVLAGGEATQ